MRPFHMAFFTEEINVDKFKKPLIGCAILCCLFLMGRTKLEANSTSSTRTALQNHVDFFDRDNDRSITVGETAEGLRALGIGWFRSWSLATAINAGLGRTTGASWYDPLTINTNKIHLGIHGSDTGVYSASGDFVRSNFETIFRLYDKNNDDALSQDEFGSFFAGYKTDSAGSVASRLEFGLLLEVAGQDQRIVGSSWWSTSTERVLTRDRLQQFYDGSLFYLVAGEPVPPHVP